MPTTILDGETYRDALQRRYSEEAEKEEQMNIVKLTDQAGSYTSVINGNTCFTYGQLRRFVELVRAEVLEEAAEWFEDDGANMMTKDECAAAIRGLK